MTTRTSNISEYYRSIEYKEESTTISPWLNNTGINCPCVAAAESIGGSTTTLTTGTADWHSRAGWAGDDETMRSYNEGVASKSPSLWPYSYTAWPNMAQVKDSMGGAVQVQDTPKVVTIDAVPVTDVKAPPVGQEQWLATPKAVARENA